MMDDSNVQRRKVKLTPDQFTFDDEGQIVIDKDAVDEVLRRQLPAGQTAEAGSITVGLSIIINTGETPYKS